MEPQHWKFVQNLPTQTVSSSQPHEETAGHSCRMCTGGGGSGARGPSFLTCCKFQGDVFVECQGPPQGEAEEPRDKKYTQEEGRSPGGDKCQRKEPREPSGRPGRALAWPEKRGGERVEGAGRPGQSPAGRLEERLPRGLRRGAGVRAGPPSHLSSEPSAQLVKEQRGPSPCWATTGSSRPSVPSPITCKS